MHIQYEFLWPPVHHPDSLPSVLLHDHRGEHMPCPYDLRKEVTKSPFLPSDKDAWPKRSLEGGFGTANREHPPPSQPPQKNTQNRKPPRGMKNSTSTGTGSEERRVFGQHRRVLGLRVAGRSCRMRKLSSHAFHSGSESGRVDAQSCRTT